MESKFIGRLIVLIGISILQELLTLITLGISTPWPVCIKEKWLVEHTIIDGRQVTIDGR